MTSLPEALMTVASFVDSLTWFASEKLVAIEMFSDESSVNMSHSQNSTPTR